MKKKIFMVFCLGMLLSFMFVPNVYATGDFTCSAFGEDVLIDNKIADIIHMIILAIQIVVPILLVIFGMIDFAKAIMAQKEDDIKKGQQLFIKRAIAAVIVFLVIAIVKLVISFVSTDDDGIMACANCFIQGSDSSSCQSND